MKKLTEQTMDWEKRFDEFWRSAIKIEGNNGKEPIYTLAKGIGDFKSFIRSEIQAAIQADREKHTEKLIPRLKLHEQQIVKFQTLDKFGGTRDFTDTIRSMKFFGDIVIADSRVRSKKI